MFKNDASVRSVFPPMRRVDCCEFKMAEPASVASWLLKIQHSNKVQRDNGTGARGKEAQGKTQEEARDSRGASEGAKLEA